MGEGVYIHLPRYLGRNLVSVGLGVWQIVSTAIFTLLLTLSLLHSIRCYLYLCAVECSALLLLGISLALPCRASAISTLPP